MCLLSSGQWRWRVVRARWCANRSSFFSAHLAAEVLVLAAGRARNRTGVDKAQLELAPTGIGAPARFAPARHYASRGLERLPNAKHETHKLEDFDIVLLRLLDGSRDIVKGKRPVTADMALRLGRRFRQAPQYWLNLQARYDLERALAAIGRPALSAIQPVAV